MATCTQCHLAIRWLRTPKGKAMPVDMDPVERGNLAIGQGRCRVLSREEADQAREEGRQLYISHFATCPGAGRFRKARSG